MKLEKRTDGWWITGVPQGTTDLGPYDTKAEAQEDKAGVERFFKEEQDA